MCVVTCPYSREDNWIHGAARVLDPRDPTGIVNSGPLWMQKNLFRYPEAEEYRRPPTGSFASFRETPEFLRTEKYLAADVVKPRSG